MSIIQHSKGKPTLSGKVYDIYQSIYLDNLDLKTRLQKLQEFKKYVEELDDQYTGEQQHDAFEFLTLIISEIDQQLVHLNLHDDDLGFDYRPKSNKDPNLVIVLFF